MAAGCGPRPPTPLRHGATEQGTGPSSAGPAPRHSHPLPAAAGWRRKPEVAPLPQGALGAPPGGLLALSQARPPWQLLDGRPQGPPQPGGHCLLALTLSPPPAPREGAGRGGEPEDWDPKTPGGQPENRKGSAGSFPGRPLGSPLGEVCAPPRSPPGPRPAATRSQADSRRGRGAREVGEVGSSWQRLGTRPPAQAPTSARAKRTEAPSLRAARRPPALGWAGTLRRNSTGSSLGPDVTQRLSLSPWPGRLISWVWKQSGFSQ